jgi:hypothetical protein
MTLEEAADRVAIRELIDAYAHCADGRDADGQPTTSTVSQITGPHLGRNNGGFTNRASILGAVRHA